MTRLYRREARRPVPGHLATPSGRPYNPAIMGTTLIHPAWPRRPVSLRLFRSRVFLRTSRRFPSKPSLGTPKWNHRRTGSPSWAVTFTNIRPGILPQSKMYIRQFLLHLRTLPMCRPWPVRVAITTTTIINILSPMAPLFIISHPLRLILRPIPARHWTEQASTPPFHPIHEGPAILHLMALHAP